MYYIYSLCIALIIFIIINNFEKKQTVTVKDLLTFIVLYIVITFISYYVYSTTQKGGSIETTSYIPENIQTGFNIASSSQ
jgi:drug/metabolite transporter (DMT)-like permease